MKEVSRVLFATLLASGLFTPAARAADQDGCWSGRTQTGSCLVEDSVTRDGAKITVKYRNQCTERLYVSACNKTAKGTWDCGAAGISPGKTWSWWTSEAEGSHKAKAIGSNQPSMDWVCSDKVSDWRWKH